MTATTGLDEHEVSFLLAEFEQAWAQVLNIDERRFKFVEYYSAISAGLVAVAVNLVVGQRVLSVATGVATATLMGAGIVIGLSFVKMILSEREANVRYRRKINVLRGLFLGSSVDPRVRAYLDRKDLGIKTADDTQPEGIGRTLKWVFFFMVLEMVVLALVALAVWIGIATGLTLS